MDKLCTNLGLTPEPLPGALRVWRVRCQPSQWLELATAIATSGGNLAALWPSPAPWTLHVTYRLGDGALWVTSPATSHQFADLASLFPGANRLQRSASDLSQRTISFAAQDQRPWLDHGNWLNSTTSQGAPYEFVRVEGEGVHEIAVGPIHAGIIEPGHFRFSVVGEKVLRLEAHLGYTHKGIHQLLRGASPSEGQRIAARVCGDSTVAYSWAYCQALETALGWMVPARAHWIRAILLERERVANHLGDLGALGNDAGFALGLAHFSRLREDWQRLSHRLFGHRLLMDCVIPGGVSLVPEERSWADLLQQGKNIESELKQLRRIYEQHAGIQDRFGGTGQVVPELARRLGLTGLAGRASGQPWDLRSHPAWIPYSSLGFAAVVHTGGDVTARVAVRFDEIGSSLALMTRLIQNLPQGSHQDPWLPPPRRASNSGIWGLGRIEGWRGEIQVALELETIQGETSLLQAHLHDPSWHNWPALEHAVLGNIVPDFPLINKSFNLAYSGVDL